MLLAFFLAAWLQSGTAKPTDWQAEGLRALEEKRYDAAVAAFNNASAADPKDYSLRFHLALACSLLNRDDEAIIHYKEALELKPGLYEAQLNLGMLLVRQKRPEEAAPFLTKAADVKPTEFRPRFYEAEALLAAGRSKDAAVSYARALTIDSKSAAAENGLARALAAGRQVDEAATHFLKAAALDPGFKDSLLELADLYEQAKRPAEATRLYEQFPENPAAQERVAQFMIDSGDVAGAIPRLEKAVKASPTSANRMLLVKAYLRQKENDKAFPLLVAAVQADPKNYDLRMLAGRMLRDQRRFPDAANQFMGAAQLKAESVEAWNELSGALIMAERYPEALGALDRVKALGAETAANHYFRAIVLDKLHQAQPAMESYQKFLAMSQGQRPDEEFKARQRVRVLKLELSKR